MGGTGRIRLQARGALAALAFCCALADGDILRGREGADTLLGDEGEDELHGGKAADNLDGGEAVDSCQGGKGTDSALSCEDTIGVPKGR